MGIFFDSGSKWNADHKIDKQQHRRDILGFRTSARPNHEIKREQELIRVQMRKEKKAAQKAESGGICGLMVLGGSGVLAALIAGAVAGARALI